MHYLGASSQPLPHLQRAYDWIIDSTQDTKLDVKDKDHDFHPLMGYWGRL